MFWLSNKHQLYISDEDSRALTNTALYTIYAMENYVEKHFSHVSLLPKIIYLRLLLSEKIGIIPFIEKLDPIHT